MIDPSLLTAFQKTRFIVRAPRGVIVLRVGKSSAKLDALLVKFGASRCAFITAWNPGSKRLSPKRNEVRQRKLIGEVRRRGYRILYGRGVGEDKAWQPEASILIIGISCESAMDLGRRFGQIAIVFAERGQAVELLFLRRIGIFRN